MRRLLYLVALLPMLVALVALPYAPVCDEGPCARPDRSELTFVFPGNTAEPDQAFHLGKYATHLVLGIAASLVLGLALSYRIEPEAEPARMGAEA